MGRWLSHIRWHVWGPLPRWVKWTVVIFLVLSFDAVRMSWSERRFVGGFFEAFVADFLYIGLPLLAAIGGIFSGVTTYESSRSKLVGWFVGILVFAGIGYLRIASEAIPGVGWRIQKMQEAHDLAEELE